MKAASELKAEWQRLRTRLNVAQGTVRPNVEGSGLAVAPASKQCHIAETALRSARLALRRLHRNPYDRGRLEASVCRHLNKARRATQQLEGVGSQAVLELWESAA